MRYTLFEIKTFLKYQNKEPPVALACVMDNDEVFKILQETGNVQLENFDDSKK